MKSADTQVRIRLPNDLKAWVEKEAKKNLRSVNAEVVFVLRDRMAEQQPSTLVMEILQ